MRYITKYKLYESELDYHIVSEDDKEYIWTCFQSSFEDLIEGDITYNFIVDKAKRIGIFISFSYRLLADGFKSEEKVNRFFETLKSEFSPRMEQEGFTITEIKIPKFLYGISTIPIDQYAEVTSSQYFLIEIQKIDK
jgi:hypothetical protein